MPESMYRGEELQMVSEKPHWQFSSLLWVAFWPYIIREKSCAPEFCMDNEDVRVEKPPLQQKYTNYMWLLSSGFCCI